MNTDKHSLLDIKPRQTRRYGQSGLVGAALVLALAACQPTQGEGLGRLGYVQGYAGMVAADEPRAALIARDTLSAGGTAADAAVAGYFTMAVTMPSAASLGGGGACVVWDPQSRQAEMLDFLPPASQAITDNTDRPSAIPGNPRGMAALHAKHGRLRWESLITPAEHLARFGVPVSRALAQDISMVADPLLRDPAVRSIFAANSGEAVAEGQRITQLDLAAVLARLRLNGAGDFYLGQTARLLATGAEQAGGSLSLDELRNFVPQWRSTLAVRVGDDTAHFAGVPATGSVIAAEILSMLQESGFARADDETRSRLLSEASSRAGVGSASDFPASAGLIVADAEGQTVACSFTMNHLFGTGRMVPGTGVILAAAPDSRAGAAYAAVAPVVVVNEPTTELRLAATASGGIGVPAALADVTARVMLAGQPLAEALTAPQGPRILPAVQPNRVQALQCTSGRAGPERCRAVTDPRGAGLAILLGGGA
ncbi:gamma-glutamyltransferase [Telmatospirillum sp. J64-1]|uniref:gamma-glutamyltransferase n=1 Tax=Telmatospirillum sp. J64-1 TaxID=2502183 RepID=UPI00115E40D0|nr:gamma-glutamyltransferase [Telmatospirillum sp. J64-1]